MGISAFYLYLENKKLKRFEIDKDVKLKEVEIEELKRLFNECYGGGILDQNDFYIRQNNLYKAIIELDHLKRLKKYRWIFNK